MKKLLITLSTALFVTGLYGQKFGVDPASFFKDVDQSELLMLGTFHFKDAGLDGYKPEYDIDIMSEQRQKELREVLDIIKKFKPTKIALEVKKSRQGHLDSLYNEYLAGRLELSANEIYQVGFRLAKELGHTKVYAIDATTRGFYDGDGEYDERENYFLKKADPKLIEREEAMSKRFFELYAAEDKQKIQHTLLESLLYENDPERRRIGHGHYIIGNFKMGEGDDYFGADSSVYWYLRNARIFHNLLRLQEDKRERVFLLIGAGHLPYLEFMGASSPDFKKRHLKEFVD